MKQLSRWVLLGSIVGLAGCSADVDTPEEVQNAVDGVGNYHPPKDDEKKDDEKKDDEKKDDEKKDDEKKPDECKPTHDDELCDGKDNDCNGYVDEGFEDVDEVCDGKDNDCDGYVDEGFKDKEELCDGEDNDCDGETDEDFLEKGLGGPCKDGTCDGYVVCAPDGKGVVCSSTAGVEACNYKDDDCDGHVDENLYLGGACDGPDADKCNDDAFQCGPNGTVVCGKGYDNKEICNGADDDCDGKVDENFYIGEKCDGDDEDSCKDGVWVCNATYGATCTDNPDTHKEVCDGKDNDCDGYVDEDFYVGQDCDGPDADQCKEGKVVCDGLYATKCSDSTADNVEQCDRKDNDCDGYEDEGFYVDEKCDGEDADNCKDGVWMCDPYGAAVCTDNPYSHVEVCDDYKDNDCDGKADQMDEDCKPTELPPEYPTEPTPPL